MPMDMLVVTWSKARGNGVQAGDPVVVVLDGGEAELGDELRIVGVDAAHLVDGHLPLLELGGLPRRRRDWRISRSRLVFSWSVKPVGSMAASCIRKFCSRGEPVVDGLHGVVGDLVVVALVADGGGELGRVLEVVFPIVVKEVVEGLAAVFKGSGAVEAVSCWAGGSGYGEQSTARRGRNGRAATRWREAQLSQRE